MTDKQKIVSLIKTACEDDRNILETDKWKDLSIDSLSFVELIVEIEDGFGITFSDEELSIYTWDTVRDLINAVGKKIMAKKNEKNT